VGQDVAGRIADRLAADLETPPVVCPGCQGRRVIPTVEHALGAVQAGVELQSTVGRLHADGVSGALGELRDDMLQRLQVDGEALEPPT
jgi:hypothetical protein